MQNWHKLLVYELYRQKCVEYTHKYCGNYYPSNFTMEKNEDRCEVLIYNSIIWGFQNWFFGWKLRIVRKICTLICLIGCFELLRLHPLRFPKLDSLSKPKNDHQNTLSCFHLISCLPSTFHKLKKSLVFILIFGWIGRGVFMILILRVLSVNRIFPLRVLTAGAISLFSILRVL